MVPAKTEVAVTAAIMLAIERMIPVTMMTSPATVVFQTRAGVWLRTFPLSWPDLDARDDGRTPPVVIPSVVFNHAHNLGKESGNRVILESLVPGCVKHGRQSAPP